jgi:hypothetical protein
MALDKQFLKYKLEKIKNDRIWKDQDSETKQEIRKENAKLAAEEADAIHSYLTGEDNIDALDNKSFLENRLPGSLHLTPKGQLNIIQSQTDPKTKKGKLSRLLKRFKTVAKANIDFSKRLVIFRRVFNKLNIMFTDKYVSMDGDLHIGGDLIFKKSGERASQKITPDGYIELPGGMTMQWGFDTSDTDSDHIITFPVEFRNTCFSVVVNHQLSGGWNDGGRYGYPITAHSYTKTGFTINRNNDASETINLNYIAIGF